MMVFISSAEVKIRTVKQTHDKASAPWLLKEINCCVVSDGYAEPNLPVVETTSCWARSVWARVHSPHSHWRLLATCITRSAETMCVGWWRRDRGLFSLGKAPQLNVAMSSLSHTAMIKEERHLLENDFTFCPLSSLSMTELSWAVGHEEETSSVTIWGLWTTCVWNTILDDVPPWVHTH